VTGQSYDGTAVPLGTAYLSLGLATLLIILVTERGRLFYQGRNEQTGIRGARPSIPA
jgi:hypothetical protein